MSKDATSTAAAAEQMQEAGALFCAAARAYNEESVKLEPLRETVESAYAAFIESSLAAKEAGLTSDELVELSVEILREGGTPEEEIEEALAYREQLLALTRNLDGAEKSAVL